LQVQELIDIVARLKRKPYALYMSPSVSYLHAILIFSWHTPFLNYDVLTICEGTEAGRNSHKPCLDSKYNVTPLPILLVNRLRLVTAFKVKKD
jgi:hypothetical protein